MNFTTNTLAVVVILAGISVSYAQLASSTRRLRTGGGKIRKMKGDTYDGIPVFDNSVSMSLPSSILYGGDEDDGGSGSSPSRSGKSGKEDNLFDQMFEIELNENYEDNFHFRNIERAEKEARERETFRK